MAEPGVPPLADGEEALKVVADCSKFDSTLAATSIVPLLPRRPRKKKVAGGGAEPGCKVAVVEVDGSAAP